MSQVDINLIAVLVAAVVNMVVGSIWYSQGVFGKTWMSLIGKNEKDFKEMKKKANTAYALSFIGALVMSYALAHFIYWTQATNFVEGMRTGFLLWVGFVATVSFNNHLFTQKPVKLCLIDSGYYLASLICMSVVLAVWS